MMENGIKMEKELQNDTKDPIHETLMQSDYQEIVTYTRNLLEKNQEWRNRYLRYANEISDNLVRIKTVRATFREWSPLNPALSLPTL